MLRAFTDPWVGAWLAGDGGRALYGGSSSPVLQVKGNETQGAEGILGASRLARSTHPSPLEPRSPVSQLTLLLQRTLLPHLSFDQMTL